MSGETYTIEDLQQMSMDDLRAIAADYDINTRNKGQAQLIEEIVQAVEAENQEWLDWVPDLLAKIEEGVFDDYLAKIAIACRARYMQIHPEWFGKGKGSNTAPSKNNGGGRTDTTMPDDSRLLGIGYKIQPVRRGHRRPPSLSNDYIWVRWGKGEGAAYRLADLKGHYFRINRYPRDLAGSVGYIDDVILKGSTWYFKFYISHPAPELNVNDPSISGKLLQYYESPVDWNLHLLER